uniref:Uncharacterized protein n=1 Tax=Kalanchoe fedtschenkoi TaxID=63787 RepID=A0A7N0T2D9_KALFE
MGCGKSKPANVASGNTVVAEKKTVSDKPVGEKSVQENAGKVDGSLTSSDDHQPGNQTVAEAQVAAAEPEKKASEAVKGVDSDPAAVKADEGVTEEPVVAEKVKAGGEDAPEVAPAVVEVAAPVEEEPVEVEAPAAEEAASATENAKSEATPEKADAAAAATGSK